MSDWTDKLISSLRSIFFYLPLQRLHPRLAVDLGPEGGDGGGTVVVTGTPEEVAECEQSFTGQYLKRALDNWGR